VPSISIPGDGLVGEGSVFTFTALATDADLPSQPLTFSLDPVFRPAGASINPTNGVFTWQPSEAQGPGAYTVVVRVQDNGTPALSNSAAILIIVNESNTPPLLAAITNRTALLGEVVSFLATATDADLPAQTITFDFGVVPPIGAAINPTNGLFSCAANNVGTNTFVIRATDNGVPVLEDTRSFEVVVVSPEMTASIGLANAIVTLSWNAVSGKNYDVLFKSSLDELEWSVLATNILATNVSATITDPVGTNTQRIYKILLRP